LIPQGEADVLLAFELAEAVRWLAFLSPEARVVVSRQRMIPPIVSTGLAEYPEDAEATLKSETREPILVDAFEIAEALGNARLVNTILLGVTSQLLDLPTRTWRRVVAERVPQAFKELNLQAFERGQALA
jgi:indolepyruvate ferredoxin oxidoreductase beta subunit